MATSTKKEVININESGRAKEKGFSEIIPASTIGPEADKAAPSDDVSIAAPQISTINTWKVMTSGDAGLKDAIYNFINTSKDGASFAPNVVNGREKKLVFDFFGTMGKCIKPGEIGQFEVVFSYPPKASDVSTVTQS